MGIKSGTMIKETLEKYYENVGLSAVGSKKDLDILVNKKPDLVILGAKRIQDNGEYIWLSEYLNQNNINYSGSGKEAMELDINKADAKVLMQKHHIPTADFFTAKPGQFLSSEQLPLSFPVFIKPYDRGGGAGIGPDSIARDFTDFQNKVQSIYDKYGAFSLVEKYLEGREFSVGLLGGILDNCLDVMPIELITKPNDQGDCILGSLVKKEDNERALKITDAQVYKQVSKVAKDAYEALGGRDYGRIDIRMDKQGKAYFIEANLNPGIAQNDFTSYFTHACNINLNIDYKAMILRIAELGLSRAKDQNIYVKTFETIAVSKIVNPALSPV